MINHGLEAYSWLNLLGASAVLIIYGILIKKDKKNIYYYVAPISWAVPSTIFNLIYLVFAKQISDQFFDVFASILDLQAFILVIAVGVTLLWLKFISRKKSTV